MKRATAAHWTGPDAEEEMTTASTAEPGPDWYRGFRRWARGRIGVGAVLSYMTELIGTGTVASEAEAMEWMRPFHRAFDFLGDGIRGDVKRAFHRKRGWISFAVPKSGDFDCAEVDEIVLVWLWDEDVNVEHYEYRPDGAVTVTIVATPTAVWRVPAGEMNRMMCVTGLRPKWGNITPEDLAPFLVRGECPPA